MTTTTPPQPQPGKALTRPQQQRLTLRKLFDSQKPELAQLLPKGMDPDRLYRMALTECVKNPKLLECSAESWALAMQTCAAQGLYPDSSLGYMYLIPSNNSKKDGDRWVKVMEVRAQRGYQGDIKLARNTGEVTKIGAEVVYAKDTYKVTKGLDPNIEHLPYDGDDDPGALRACYAVAKLASGEVVFVTLTKRDVMRHRASAQYAEDKDSPWQKHEAAMWKKTAIRELFKWLPKASDAAEQVARAIASDGDGRVFDTTAVDLGSVSLPAAGETGAGSALDQVADALETAAGTTAQAAPPEGPVCPDHPAQTIVNGDESRACFADGCKWTAPAPAKSERQPGSDDAPSDPRAAVQALADKAGDTTKGRARQGRLQE